MEEIRQLICERIEFCFGIGGLPTINSMVVDTLVKARAAVKEIVAATLQCPVLGVDFVFAVGPTPNVGFAEWSKASVLWNGFPVRARGAYRVVRLMQISLVSGATYVFDVLKLWRDYESGVNESNKVDINVVDPADHESYTFCYYLPKELMDLFCEENSNVVKLFVGASNDCSGFFGTFGKIVYNICEVREIYASFCALQPAAVPSKNLTKYGKLLLKWVAPYGLEREISAEICQRGMLNADLINYVSSKAYVTFFVAASMYVLHGELPTASDNVYLDSCVAFSEFVRRTSSDSMDPLDYAKQTDRIYKQRKGINVAAVEEISAVSSITDDDDEWEDTDDGSGIVEVPVAPVAAAPDIPSARVVVNTSVGPVVTVSAPNVQIVAPGAQVAVAQAGRGRVAQVSHREAGNVPYGDGRNVNVTVPTAQVRGYGRGNRISSAPGAYNAYVNQRGRGRGNYADRDYFGSFSGAKVMRADPTGRGANSYFRVPAQPQVVQVVNLPETKSTLVLPEARRAVEFDLSNVEEVIVKTKDSVDVIRVGVSSAVAGPRFSSREW